MANAIHRTGLQTWNPVMDSATIDAITGLLNALGAIITALTGLFRWRSSESARCNAPPRCSAAKCGTFGPETPNEGVINFSLSHLQRSWRKCRRARLRVTSKRLQPPRNTVQALRWAYGKTTSPCRQGFR